MDPDRQTCSDGVGGVVDNPRKFRAFGLGGSNSGETTAGELPELQCHAKLIWIQGSRLDWAKAVAGGQRNAA
ncbi:hypothetical protein CIB48_g4664 [Xylaria polymorpha]|nr:hypothetical protein CIB48_g4664 [Xylaria polymorpha]